MAGFWRNRQAWPGTLAASAAVITVAALGGIGGQGWGSVFRGRARPVRMVPGPGLTPFVQSLYRLRDGNILTGYPLPDGSLPGAPLPGAKTIGAWELTFHGEDPNEAENVALCVRALDGAIVPPGAVFSFNETVGERTAERGFRPGLMYVAGQVVTGLGGGVCIPSTALYNAALNADMEILERHAHSGPVSYATPGLDAAVVFGLKDFRFRNTSSAPIAIRANVMGNTLAIGITGTPVPGRRVVVERTEFAPLPFEERQAPDAAVPQGEPRVKHEGRAGWVATVVRTVFQDGKVVRRETVSRDTVAPRERVVLINPLDDPESPEALAAKAAEEALAPPAAAGIKETPASSLAPDAASPPTAVQPKKDAAKPAKPGASEAAKPAQAPAPPALSDRSVVPEKARTMEREEPRPAPKPRADDVTPAAPHGNGTPASVSHMQDPARPPAAVGATEPTPARSDS